MPVILTSHLTVFILKGHSGVTSFIQWPITVPAALPASATGNGFAVNIGSAGNIEVLDVTSCTID